MPPHDEEEKIGRLRRAMYSRKFSDSLGPRERRKLDPEREEVPEDWEHEDAKEAPTILPLEAMMPPRASAVRAIVRWALIASGIFFAGTLIFFAYYLFFGGAFAISSRNIDIAITGPAQIAGGELTNLEITVTNHNKESLELADLVTTFPSGTRLNPESCTFQTCRVSLGTIASGASLVVKLPAAYQGGAGQSARVSVELEYRLAGSNSIFVASSQYGFVFSSSPLSIAVDGNTQTISGQPMRLTLTLSSNANQPISDVLLSGNYPFGFKLTAANPAANPSGLWEIGTLSPGQGKTITLDGVLTGEVGDTRVFHFTAGTKMTATSTSIDAPLSDTSLAVTIAQPFLDVGISVNDAKGEKPVAVVPGDIVNVSVAYKNNLSSSIQNAVIVARLSGISIDGATVHSEDGFYRSTDNAVLWDKTTTGGALASLASGAGGKLSFTFQVPSSQNLQGIQNPILNISVSAAGTRLGESSVPENLQSTAAQKIVVASDLSLASQGLYFTDPFGASGPLPPKAGVETTYAVVLSITNTTNKIMRAKVVATLPPYTRLVGNHYLPASEKVTFNGTTGVFTWDVGDIAPGVGLNSTPPRQVVIELGFTPSTSQIDTEPTLLQGISLMGTDESTGKQVQKSASDVTTNIVGDPGFSSINAKVVK